MRLLTLMITALILSGCVNLGAMKDSISNREGADTSYYLIDAKFRFFCLGNTRQCRDMTKVVSSRSMLVPIEKAYGAKVKGPNYPVTLTRMLMTPLDGSYEATPVGSQGRYFKVPVNDKTNIAWDTLSDIENKLFDSGS